MSLGFGTSFWWVLVLEQWSNSKKSAYIFSSSRWFLKMSRILFYVAIGITSATIGFHRQTWLGTEHRGCWRSRSSSCARSSTIRRSLQPTWLGKAYNARPYSSRINWSVSCTPEHEPRDPRFRYTSPSCAIFIFVAVGFSWPGSERVETFKVCPSLFLWAKDWAPPWKVVVHNPDFLSTRTSAWE